MKILQYIVIMVVIAGLSFGIGYLMGAAKISEMNSKIINLADQLGKERFNVLILKTKDHLRLGNLALLQKNFGIASDEVDTARKILSEGSSTISDQGKIFVSKLDSSIVEIQTGISKLDLKTREKINLIISEIDKITVVEN